MNLGVDTEGHVIVFDFDCAFPIGARRYGKIYNGGWEEQVSLLFSSSRVPVLIAY